MLERSPCAGAEPIAPSVVQAAGGHASPVFYVGGNSRNNLWKWTDGLANWELLVPARGASQARRFFVNPYDPNVIYLVDTQNVKRSDDGGETWQVDANLELHLSCGGRIPIARSEFVSGQNDFADIVLTDMKFDPFNANRRFAVGEAGADFRRCRGHTRLELAYPAAEPTPSLGEALGAQDEQRDDCHECEFERTD